MPTVKQFEDLNVWKASRSLVNLIYENTRTQTFSRDFALRDQIRKAAISVMSNIAEGLDSGYDAEFIRFLGFSFRSTGEVQSQLYTALDQGYVTLEEFQSAYDKAVDVRKQIRSLISYLTTNKRSGRQIRENGAIYLSGESYIVFNEVIDLPIEFLASD